MRRMSTLAVLVTATVMWAGCSSVATTPRTETAAVFAPLASEAAPSAGAESEPVAITPAVELPTPVDPQSLPPSPWSDAPLASDAVPAPILRAWANAENRGQCAPIAPVALGAGEGARARISELEGGWAVEFDRRGLPGMNAEGEPCERCGRAVFGIAGTNLTVEDLAGEGELPPSFADGSQLLVEPPAGGEQVAAASITVRGQDCVYQVWSFLGEQHVRELVSSIRLVAVQGTSNQAVAAAQ
jgi:hypothetical protein